MLYSSYWAWFIALLASPYVGITFVLHMLLFLAEFVGSFNISIQFELQ